MMHCRSCIPKGTLGHTRPLTWPMRWRFGSVSVSTYQPSISYQRCYVSVVDVSPARLPIVAQQTQEHAVRTRHEQLLPYLETLVVLHQPKVWWWWALRD